MSSVPGSSWAVWDLQVQTILDSDYKELKTYYQELKSAQTEKWAQFVELVGTEEDALLFDSKYYFSQGSGSVRHRCDNYAKTLFSFISVFAPHLRCIGVTDHNHLHDELMDSLLQASRDHVCKVLPGVEINVDGVHILAFFPQPPCAQATYGKGIRTFLSTLGIFNTKNDDGVYSLAQGGIKEVIDQLKKQHAVFVFAHCNSNNGLFQERGRTDRTHLAEIFNHSNPIVLQCRTKDGANELARYIRSNPALQSDFIITTASDGRALHDYGLPDNKGNYCFIKGLPTVEGLRQAIFEPDSRLLLADQAPIPPIHRLERIDLGFPDGAKLGEDTFCLGGDFTIQFSPNYTCLIGGRGAGKSTLLNLLQEKIQPRSNAFFNDRKLKSVDGKAVHIADHVKIDDDADKKVIDFLSQNEIEKFATNAPALTAAIYSRLEKENQGRLKRAQETLAFRLKEFQEHIHNHRQKASLAERIQLLEKERQSHEKILRSFQSQEYKALANHVATDSNSLRSFQTSKQRLTKIASDVAKLIPQKLQNEPEQTAKNEYDLAFDKIIEFLKEAKQVSDSLDTDKLNQAEASFIKALQDSKARLSQFLSEKGLKPESQQDIADANENISRLKAEIEEAKGQLAVVIEAINGYSSERLQESKVNYETTLIEQLRAANGRLNNLNAQVKTIKLEYRFDIETAKRAIFDATKEVFSLNPSELGTRESSLQEALFSVEPTELDLHEKFTEALEQRQKGRELTKAQTALIELFRSEVNFELYKLVVNRTLSDAYSYKVISVYYDGKLLQESSFGQRCTAALVLLLLLGNNPIVIDEPEGHLDSGLRAETWSRKG